MPRIEDRRFDPLRYSREGREARGSSGGDRKYYDEYGFAMTPEEYESFHSEVTKQNESFDTQRTNMMSSYDELSAGNEYDLGELWADTDKLTIQVPYKDRTGSLGEIPKSAWKDFANAIQTSPHLGKRTTIWAPLEEDVPDYLERLEEIQALHTPEGIAAKEEEYRIAADEYARSKGYYGTEKAPDVDQGEGFGDARETYHTIQYDPDHWGHGGGPSVSPAEHMARAEQDLNDDYGSSFGKASIAGLGSELYEELKADVAAAGYRSDYMGSLTYGGTQYPWGWQGQGDRPTEQGDATVARMIREYKQLNEEGIAKFTVGGDEGKAYYRALYYEMPNITSDLKGQWEGEVSQQYKESQALLNTELENAELTLQGYIDEFQTGIGSFAEEYQRDQAVREEAFSGFTIG